MKKICTDVQKQLATAKCIGKKKEKKAESPKESATPST